MDQHAADKIESLVRAFRAGDGGAFDTLFASYRPLIESSLVQYARGSDDDEARSLANEAFHSAVVHWSENGGASFGTYAKRCVVNALFRLSVSRQKECLLSDVDVDRLSVAVGVEAGLIRRETARDLCDRVRVALSDEEYRVFLRCVLGACSASEYAELTGKTKKQVENTKARVLKKLRGMPELFSILES